MLRCCLIGKHDERDAGWSPVGSTYRLVVQVLRTTVKAGSSPVAPFNLVDVVELADTLDLESSAIGVGVQIPPSTFKYCSGFMVKWLSHHPVKVELRVRFPLGPYLHRSTSG